MPNTNEMASCFSLTRRRHLFFFLRITGLLLSFGFTGGGLSLFDVRNDGSDGIVRKQKFKQGWMI